MIQSQQNNNRGIMEFGFLDFNNKFQDTGIQMLSSAAAIAVGTAGAHATILAALALPLLLNHSCSEQPDFAMIAPTILYTVLTGACLSTAAALAAKKATEVAMRMNNSSN